MGWLPGPYDFTQQDHRPQRPDLIGVYADRPSHARVASCGPESETRKGNREPPHQRVPISEKRLDRRSAERDHPLQGIGLYVSRRPRRSWAELPQEPVVQPHGPGSSLSDPRPYRTGENPGHRPQPLTRPRICLLYTSPSPRDATLSRMPSSA